jgi:teichuronic acid biosynthesis glycosyltransferase TuaG
VKASIVTPVFNGLQFIQDAVASVVAQTFEDWELIIVNDGSTDQTADLLDALTDPRIHVIHQTNAGASAARNAALDRARGQYVTFLDADDLLPPDALAIRCAILDRQPQLDIVHGSVRVTSQGQTLRFHRPDPEPGPLLQRLARLEEGVFFGVNYMIRRERIGQIRFPVALSHCEDLIFFLTLAHDVGLNYAAVPDEVYEYRLQPRSAMSNLDGLERGYLELLARSRSMAGIDAETRAIQRRRIERILFRSWLRRFKPLRALSATSKVRRAAN